MRKLFLSLMAACCLAVSVRSQDIEQTPDMLKIPGIFYGVNFAGGFGKSYKLLSLSPQAGYRFNRFLAAGGGLNLLYTQTKYPQLNLRDVSHGVGLNLFGRFYPIEHVFLNVQPEFNYMTGKRKYDYGKTVNLNSGFVASLLTGVGVSLPPLGKRGFSMIMVQWDVLQQTSSPYDNNFNIVLGFHFQPN